MAFLIMFFMVRSLLVGWDWGMGRLKEVSWFWWRAISERQISIGVVVVVEGRVVWMWSVAAMVGVGWVRLIWLIWVGLG